ncbi:type II secretion system F family protein [Microbacterium sp. 2FI]|uniref:type II secretion system F family protein n=1 Tax=Microbacterium sp. 2FI TaxID=2502193 RepID=UPI0010F859C9|nr:type II secretion system F family protein [Microbacterium sp. 2FI]
MAARMKKTDAAPAADTVLRLAVLLQAGIAPARAWSHLAATGDAAAAKIVGAVGRGSGLADAIADADASGRGGWPEVASAWRLATTVGAPLAESLRGLATALLDAQEAADEVRVALAEPAGTARLMAWLPLVAVGLGAVLGFDTFAVLLGSPAGIACLVGGGLLIAAANRWTAVLVRRARPDGGIPGHRAELLAIALSGGVSIERATALVAHAGEGSAAAAKADGDAAATVLALSSTAGVPAVELLRASAAFERHRARVDGRLRAARLSSRLLLPLGACTLPAFLLLGVAPMLLSVLSSASLSL